LALRHPEVRAAFGEPRKMRGKGELCGPSFEARKSAHLRMTVSPSSEQLLDIAQLQFHIGRPAVIALA
jgi:hypothetical protein